MVWKRGGLVAEVRTESAGRVALLHLDATQPVVLDGTAAAIWELIDGRRAQADVIAELEATFEDSAGRLGLQVEAFLASLEAQRLIELSRSTDSGSAEQ
jgi:hypothetical protein